MSSPLIDLGIFYLLVSYFNARKIYEIYMETKLLVSSKFHSHAFDSSVPVR